MITKPMRAKLVKQPEQWHWNNASAHIKTKNDILIDVFPSLSIVQDDWERFLSKAESFEQIKNFHKHERTGRPLADNSFVQMLE